MTRASCLAPVIRLQDVAEQLRSSPKYILDVSRIVRCWCVPVKSMVTERNKGLLTSPPLVLQEKLELSLDTLKNRRQLAVIYHVLNTD